MKHYILNILIVAVLLMGLVASCDKEAEGAIYTENEMAFSFVMAKQAVEVSVDDAGIIKVPVYRAGNVGEAKAQIVLDEKSAAENVLKLQTPEVVFKNGEFVAYAELNFGSVDNLSAAKYVVVLTFKEGTNLSLSAQTKTEITVKRK